MLAFYGNYHTILSSAAFEFIPVHLSINRGPSKSADFLVLITTYLIKLAHHLIIGVGCGRLERLQSYRFRGRHFPDSPGLELVLYLSCRLRLACARPAILTWRKENVDLHTLEIRTTLRTLIPEI